MTHSRTITIAGLVAWLMVALPAVLQPSNSQRRLIEWAIAYALFGLLFVAETRRPSLVLLALQAASIVAIVLIMCDGFEGTLMVLIAMRLGTRLTVRSGMAWIVMQTLLLAAAIGIHWTPRSALLLAPPYFGFQLLAFFTMHVLTRELATRETLARAKERLRMAHELHDALGHQLTALTLNLEAALHRSGGDAQEDVRKAQGLAREALADVRSIVAETEPAEHVDLATALRALIASVPRPRVHLQIDPTLTIEDPARGHILFRCAQELVTNAVRHSGAENLWIEITRHGGRLEIRAHDDGRGSDTAIPGFGLRGMRSRIEGAGGELNVIREPGSGFGIVAVLPS